MLDRLCDNCESAPIEHYLKQADVRLCHECFVAYYGIFLGALAFLGDGIAADLLETFLKGKTC